MGVLSCPACSGEVSDASRFCPQCAAPLTASRVPTLVGRSTATTARWTGTTGSWSSSDSLVESRFLPGDMLAGRYRIVGPIGRGGMGEVFRADDLRLGQPVALKFLPESLEQDPDRLARFFNEVRMARQVTHPNVCRVHDVEEHEGHHFLSMEYVDGEDLGSLLRRIGRLPEDKAVQIARQICAGLAAAHQKGILHRDLKPANVMVDGKGQVRLTDFGLAAFAAQGAEGDARVGTPAYMAPEQIDGSTVTTRSDLYALGLVLYELFTGRPAFSADTFADMRRMQRESTPQTPSSLVEQLDPAVERAILRCLDPDPRLRPPTAFAVAVALPGGDPLAAALSAGEIPSPEMVAAAGEEGALNPRLGLICLVGVIAALVGIFAISAKNVLPGRVDLPLPPEALAAQARQVIESAGYDEPPSHTVWGFNYDTLWQRHVEDTQPPGPDRWAQAGRVRPAPVRFWYRQSPRPIVPENFIGFVTLDDPRPVTSGEIDVTLDPRGRLLTFLAIPPEEDPRRQQNAASAVDWNDLITRTGIDPATLAADAPVRNPLIDCDQRRAWRAAYPDQPAVPIRLEACSYGSRPAWFAVLAPWSRPTRMAPITPKTMVRVLTFVAIGMAVAVLGGACVMARRNTRLGRGDRRGAMRLATTMFVLVFAYWCFRIDHVPDLLPEMLLLLRAARGAMFNAVIAWVLYISLEPYVRRLWPDALISWSRLVSGRLRDPLVGRDILLGALAGSLVGLGFQLAQIAPRSLGGLAHPPAMISLDGLVGMRQAIASLVIMVANSLLTPVALFFVVLVFRVLFRGRQGPAVGLAVGLIGLVAVVPTLAQIGGGAPVASMGVIAAQVVLEFLAAILLWGAIFRVMTRLGLLALLVTWLHLGFYAFINTTIDPGSWYFGRALFGLALMAILATWAWSVARAGRPLIREGLLPT